MLNIFFLTLILIFEIMKQIYLNLIALLFTSICIAQPAGSLDPTFGTNGLVTANISAGLDVGHGIALQPDGKIIVGGYTTNTATGTDFLCIRLMPNGAYDTSFGVNGIAQFDLQIGSEDKSYDIALLNNGKIIMVGQSDNGIQKDAALIQLNTNGTLDSIFGVNGIRIADLDSSFMDVLKTVKVNALTGKITVGGSAQSSVTRGKPVIARFLSNGNFDSTFNGTGKKVCITSNLDYQYLAMVEEVEISPNGNVSASG
jgi:uncharacterized delta-60 repeat protein